jgi:hypothetical protein
VLSDGLRRHGDSAYLSARVDLGRIKARQWPRPRLEPFRPAILDSRSQICCRFGVSFGTGWNRLGVDRRKTLVWVPNPTFYGGPVTCWQAVAITMPGARLFRRNLLLLNSSFCGYQMVGESVYCFGTMSTNLTQVVDFRTPSKDNRAGIKSGCWNACEAWPRCLVGKPGSRRWRQWPS